MFLRFTEENAYQSCRFADIIPAGIDRDAVRFHGLDAILDLLPGSAGT